MAAGWRWPSMATRADQRSSSYLPPLDRGSSIPIPRRRPPRVRLLVVDRPGYGESTPLPAGTVPTMAGLADDVAAALGSLVVDAVGVVGWSAGGRFALALAATRPDLVRAVAPAATPAPDDEVPWIPDESGRR
jgi:pimeloyl-ACP methyl ester carboxylesterase